MRACVYSYLHTRDVLNTYRAYLYYGFTADEVLLIDSPDLMRSLGDRAAELIRAWSYKTFYSCLSEQRTEDEKSNILNDYYNSLSEVLVSSLGSHCYDIPIIAVHFEKRQS